MTRYSYYSLQYIRCRKKRHRGTHTYLILRPGPTCIGKCQIILFHFISSLWPPVTFLLLYPKIKTHLPQMKVSTHKLSKPTNGHFS